MKKLLLLFLSITIFACNTSIDENTAKTKVSELLELLKNHEYEKTNEYYTASLNESESVEARTKKFEQIESASGKIVSYECTKSSKQEADGQSVVLLTYKVKCSNLTLTETFTVMMDEGEYKIASQIVTNV
jgi:hypothetical protein